MSFASRARHWLPLLPWLGLLGATYWLNQQAQPDPVMPGGNTRHDPDSIVENFSAINMNPQGTPGFIMKATRMMHYPDDGSATLYSPSVTILSEGRPPLTATARTAYITEKGNDVFLQDDVLVLREGDPKQGPLKLTTGFLHIIPDQGLASTDQPVTLTEPNTVMNAVGLELDNNRRSIRLLANVKSEYVPTNR